MSSTMECPCGEPHPASPAVEDLITQLGEFTTIEVLGGGRWRIPRIYIARHGIRARDIPFLATVYGFEQVGSP